MVSREAGLGMGASNAEIHSFNDHNSSEIHQKGKKLVCFGKFSLNAAGLASNLSILVEKWHRKMNMKLATPL